MLTRRAVTANPWALAAAILAVGLQILALLLPPLSRVLRLSPLDATEWAVVIVLSAIPAVTGQLLKARARH
jgi:hypothetical protein